MALKITSDIQSRIAELIRTGDFADENDVLTHAITSLEQDRKLAHLREIIDKADAEVARGEVVEGTPELFRSIRGKVEASVAAGEPVEINSDVWPIDAR